jgi:hypothetical protein
MNKTFHKIILPARPQPDTIVAIFFLKNFGKDKYPGLTEAEIEILQELPKGGTPETLSEKGILVLDLGGGTFDHHAKGKTLSQIVAEDLDIFNNPAIGKLLAYAERDDKHGKGTISIDQLDKAFGLSGLIASLNKSLSDKPEKVIAYVLPFLAAHYNEEKKRTEELPKEYEEKLKQGKAEYFEVKDSRKKLKIVIIESDSVSMAGWLRSTLGVRADVVCQKGSSGYVNILTRPLKKVNLQMLAAYLRIREAELKNKNVESDVRNVLMSSRIPEVGEWYYDRATNSILNGGTNPKGIEPTKIPLAEIKEIIKLAFSQREE